MELIGNHIINKNSRIYNEYLPISSIHTLDKKGNKLINFSSTQYLGIPWRVDFNNNLKELNISGDMFGSLGSNYLGGTHPKRLHLERKLSNMLDYEDAICFSSGWTANFSICEFLGKNFDLVISDVKNHNSIITGLKSIKIEKLIFDLNAIDLSRIISDNKDKKIAIIYPSIEGITGIETNLNFSCLKDREKVTIIADECHSFGIIGEMGTDFIGSIKPDVRIISFSKAVGIMGAAIVTTRNYTFKLSQLSSPWIYSTAIPPIIWEVISLSIDTLNICNKERDEINSKSKKFREQLSKLSIEYSGSHQITGIHYQNYLNPRLIENEFRSAGFLIIVSEPPTTKNGELISRIAIQPEHELKDIFTLTKIIYNLKFC